MAKKMAKTLIIFIMSLLPKAPVFVPKGWIP